MRRFVDGSLAAICLVLAIGAFIWAVRDRFGGATSPDSTQGGFLQSKGGRTLAPEKYKRLVKRMTKADVDAIVEVPPGIYVSKPLQNYAAGWLNGQQQEIWYFDNGRLWIGYESDVSKPLEPTTMVDRVVFSSFENKVSDFDTGKTDFCPW